MMPSIELQELASPRAYICHAHLLQVDEQLSQLEVKELDKWELFIPSSQT